MDTATLVIITGASKGYGREVALTFSNSIRSKVHFVILGRDEEGLNDTKVQMLAMRDSLGLETSARIVTADLSDMNNLSNIADNLFNFTASCQLSKIIFVDNAGLLGHLGKIGDENINSAEYLHKLMQALNCNVTASMFLSSELIRKYDAYRSTTGYENSKLIIVSISSLCAIQAFEHFSTYCASKAAKDMFYKVLAAERLAVGDSRVKVLMYAPGPMETAMTDIICNTSHAKQNIFLSMRENKSYVATSVSAAKLVKLVVWEAFTSGSHIDYFDPLPEGPGLTEPTTCCACVDCSCGVDCTCKRVGKRLCDACAAMV